MILRNDSGTEMYNRKQSTHVLLLFRTYNRSIKNPKNWEDVVAHLENLENPENS